jgi:hypothetical protein
MRSGASITRRWRREWRPSVLLLQSGSMPSFPQLLPDGFMTLARAERGRSPAPARRFRELALPFLPSPPPHRGSRPREGPPDQAGGGRALSFSARALWNFGRSQGRARAPLQWATAPLARARTPNERAQRPLQRGISALQRAKWPLPRAMAPSSGQDRGFRGPRLPKGGRDAPFRGQCKPSSEIRSISRSDRSCFWV